MGQEEDLKKYLADKFGKTNARRFDRYVPALVKAGYVDADSIKSAYVDDLLKLGLPEWHAEQLSQAHRGNGLRFFIKVALVPGLLGFALVAFAIYYLKNFVVDKKVLRFLDAPLLKDLPEFTPEYQNEMLWGTYRTGHYIGLRTRQPFPMVAGAMWFDPDNLEEDGIRHEAQQSDNLKTFGWLQHDGKSFGEQALQDGPYNITMHWVKKVSPTSGPGGDWVLRIRAEATGPGPSGRKPTRLALVYYLLDADQPEDSWLLFPPRREKIKDAQEGGYILAGNSRSLGHWALHLQTTSSAPVHYYVFPMPEELPPHMLKQGVIGLLSQTAQSTRSAKDLHIPDGYGPNPNASLFQISMTLPGTADLVFMTNLEQGSEDRLQELRGSKLSSSIAQHKREFSRDLEEQLLSGSSDELDEATKKVISAAISNMVGGMGYFYGESLVQLPGRAGTVEPYGPSALYTCVPSRSFFPRGFLWDEGFHQLLLQRLHPKLSRDVLAHWLDLMNTYGWIPREQILGAEARTRVVGDEYIVQHPHHANPPSLFLPLARMAETLEDPDKAAHPADVEANREFLQMAWPRLEAWFEFYNRTQQGPMDFTFKWHGRNETTELELNPRTLMSGLDDYPRASHPGEIEMHLDLRCWMALASRTMTIIATALGMPPEVIAPYKKMYSKLSSLDALNRMHRDERNGMYLDFGNHTNDAHMQELQTIASNGEMQSMTVRVVEKPPTLQLVNAFGYVSLFPFFMQLFPPESQELAVQLKLLTDTSLLYSPFGLRSLAVTSPFYRKYNTKHDAPYWRGPVWINMNYLALRSLHYYCHREGPSQARACEIHKELRELVLGNIIRQYEATGYLWEQYDDMSGQGKGCKPFTGWTALVALIAAEAY